MAEGGVEKTSMRTVLGIDDEGISTSETYNLVVRDHGVKSGLKFESVCITPVVEVRVEDLPEKTVQVLYTEDSKVRGNLKFATVAVCETPREISDTSTVSKTVFLRSNKPGASGETNPMLNFAGPNVFASDPEALGCMKFGGNEPSKFEETGIFASDPEALKFVRFDSSGSKSASNTSGVQLTECAGAVGDEASDEIFVSDPEVLKYIKLGPPPTRMNEASGANLPVKVLSSGPEALRCIRFGPSDFSATGGNEDELEIFASDPETLNLIQFGDPKPASAIPQTQVQIPTEDREGSVIAEATGIQLKDDRTYSVRVSGHELPDGQQKKFVAVRTTEAGGPCQEEIDRMQITVETVVGKDGLVEKFVVVE